MQFRSSVLSRLRPLALALGAAGALVVPSAASAGTLTVDHGAHSATYTANAGEDNNLSFYRLSTTYRIQDEPAGSVPLTEIGGSLCSMGEPWKYRCPVASVASASVSLGDGTDSFDATVSSVSVTLTAGTGVKNIKTGSGDDKIAARNGSADQIVCGPGADIVLADPEDVVDASCEQVNPVDANGVGTDGSVSDGLGGDAAGESPGSSTSGTDGSQDVFKTPVGLTVAIATVPVSNSNALVRLACAAEAVAGCRGDVTLELPLAAKKSKTKAKAARGQYVAQQRRRGRRIGKRNYRIGAGKKKTIAVPVLLRSHYRYVSRRRRTRAVMRITERDPAGKVIDVQTHSITLKPRKPANKRGQR